MRERQQPPYKPPTVDTHRGICSACGSRHIRQWKTRQGGVHLADGVRFLVLISLCAVLFLIGIAIFPVLAFFAICGGLLVIADGLRNRPETVETHRACQQCGHQWRV